MILALTLAWWPAYARLARSVIVSVRHQPYIEALQVLGAPEADPLQRALVAMAITGEPSLLIADEPTTALDVTTQAHVLELLRQVQREHEMGLVLITPCWNSSGCPRRAPGRSPPRFRAGSGRGWRSPGRSRSNRSC